MNNRGFSLTALLVVSLILFLLTTIALPWLARARRVEQDRICLRNLGAIGMAVRAYAHDFKNRVPFMSKEWTGMEPLVMKKKPIGLGLLVPRFVPRDMLEIFQAPRGCPSVYNGSQWGRAEYVMGDYQYWQHRFPQLFREEAEETVLTDLQKHLLVSDQIGQQEFEGFDIKANHPDGVHFLRGDGSVDYYSWPLREGIPTTVASWPELKQTVRAMDESAHKENNE
ncbi:type II secretion system protein [Planctomycetota bacterium]